ncbi:M48 family metalloprotease [Sphaerisporangium fuscum]|uniref:M48 family metalloprotease n=1 Tax=Sphaerisporangium fuscum TaxID=2835868 RepID=UPI001BDD6379|nr:M48 family metalloprotease [Sphaerisporangium fuscum]
MDPFALPPPTTARLRLLFLTVAGASYFAGYWFIVWGQDSWAGRNRACLADGADLVACTSRVLALQSVTPLAGPLLVSALTVLAYLAAPAVVSRWQKAAPLEEVPAALRETIRAAGLAAEPELVRRRRDNRWAMFAFGRRPRYRVLLPATAMLRLRARPRDVTALLAHELGHLKNRDVDRSHLALFATVCFVIVVGAATLAASAMSQERSTSLALAWRLALLTALVVATFVGVLRAREHDADLWAGRSHASELLGLLDGSAAERPWLVRVHPSFARRRRVLEEPGLTMRTSVPESLAAGVAGGVAIVELSAPAQTFLPLPALVTYWLVASAVALPITGVVGLAVWRSTLYDLSTGTRRTRVAGPGLALGTGLLLGAILAPRASAQWNVLFASAPESTVQLTFLQGKPLTVLGLALGLPTATTLILNWVALTARVRLSRHGVRAWRPAALAAALVFGVALGTWFLAARLAAADEWGPGALAALALRPRGVAAGVLAFVVLGCCASAWPPGRDGLARPAALLAGALATLVLLGAVVSGAIGGPLAHRPPAVLPESNERQLVCLWLRVVGTRALGDAGDHATRARLGAFLQTVPDPHMRRAGELMSESARRRSDEMATAAWTLFVRRCDLLKRYPPDDPVPTFTPPFPTLGE